MDDLDTTNGDGHTGQFDRRIVSAAGAPPAAAPGAVTSPFLIAQQYAANRGLELAEQPQVPRTSASPAAAAAADVASKPPATPMARAKLTLQACGELTTEQLAETLEIDLKTARTVVQNGITKGYWARVTGADGVKRIKLTTPPPAQGAAHSQAESGRCASEEGEDHNEETAWLQALVVQAWGKASSAAQQARQGRQTSEAHNQAQRSCQSACKAARGATARTVNCPGRTTRARQLRAVQQRHVADQQRNRIGRSEQGTGTPGGGLLGADRVSAAGVTP
ncbi:MAG: hypothetical protein AB7P37_21125 [Ramlibacter sp.]